jgi:hypothetical protein
MLCTRQSIQCSVYRTVRLSVTVSRAQRAECSFGITVHCPVRPHTRIPFLRWHLVAGARSARPRGARCERGATRRHRRRNGTEFEQITARARTRGSWGPGSHHDAAPATAPPHTTTVPHSLSSRSRQHTQESVQSCTGHAAQLRAAKTLRVQQRKLRIGGSV